MTQNKAELVLRWLEGNADGMKHDEPHMRWHGGCKLDAIYTLLRKMTHLTIIELWAAPIGVYADIEYNNLKVRVDITDDIVLRHESTDTISYKIIDCLTKTFIDSLLKGETEL